MRRILFVDDEPMLLLGLQRSLRPMRSEWTMEFVNSGADAVEAMTRSAFDAVVTDMRMPGMNGAQLLDHVRLHHPLTLRFVLSGQFDHESSCQTVSSAHQCFAKPCDIGELQQKLASALALREVLENTSLKEVVSQIKNLPSLPSLYCELVEKLESPLTTMKEVSGIIERDMAMTSKILQLVNSAFFGLGHRISNPAQAVSLLGTEVLKSLALSLGVFSQLNTGGIPSRHCDLLWKHSIITSRMARKVAEVNKQAQRLADDSFLAGLLHDIGELILASERSREYERVVQMAEQESLSMWEAEHKVFGCTHAEIGGYLLGIWGVPSHVVEAVVWHHRPSLSAITHPGSLVAVHVANCVSSSIDPYRPQHAMEMDRAFLARCGLEGKESALVGACKGIITENNPM